MTPDPSPPTSQQQRHCRGGEPAGPEISRSQQRATSHNISLTLRHLQQEDQPGDERSPPGAMVLVLLCPPDLQAWTEAIAPGLHQPLGLGPPVVSESQFGSQCGHHHRRTMETLAAASLGQSVAMATKPNSKCGLCSHASSEDAECFRFPGLGSGSGSG